MRVTIPDLQPGSRYALQFRSKNSTEVSSWSRTFVVDTGQDTTPPAMPTGVSLEVSGDSFLAEWNEVTQNEDGSTMVDFSHYNVKLRNVDNNYYVVMKTNDVKYELTFNLNIALFSPVAGTLAVSVAAVDQTGNESEYTEEVVRQNPPPGPVRDLVAVGGYEAITSNWNPPADLESDFLEYRLFISSTPEMNITNQSQPVWRGNGTSYVYATATLTPMYVHVIAVDKFNSISIVTTAGPVEVKSSTEIDDEEPGVPTNLGAVIEGNSLDVAWTPPTDNDLLGYQIAYRKVSKDWSYTTATYDDNSTSITPVEEFVDYEVRIRAYDTSFNYSVWSSIVLAEGLENTPPAAPTGLAVSGALSTAMVTWDRNDEPDMDFYELQFNDSSPGDDDKITSTTSTIAGFTVPEGTYYARVRAVDRGGLRSAWSPVVSGEVGFDWNEAELPKTYKHPDVKPDVAIHGSIWHGPNGEYQIYREPGGWEDIDIGWEAITNVIITNADIKNAAIDNAKIADAAIDNAKIQDATIESAKIKNLEADKLIAGDGIINDLQVKSKLTIGNSENLDGAIESHLFNSNTGYRLSRDGLIVNSGAISARALDIQFGRNHMPAMYADFEFSPSHYVGAFTSNFGSSPAVLSGGGRFGEQYLSFETFGGFSVANIHMAPSTGTYNVEIDPDVEQIVSGYVRNWGSDPINVSIGMQWEDGSSTVFGTEEFKAPGPAWVRIAGKAMPPAGVTKGHMYFITDQYYVELNFDGLQVEAVTAGGDTASPWSPPSQTTIDGGAIRTGEIRSNQNINVNGTQQPAWSINMQGGMQIGSAVIRGNVTVGSSQDGAQTMVQSYNYTPAGSLPGEGWIIRSDGSAEFNNIRVGANSIGPEAIDAVELWADDLFASEARLGVLTVGSISPEMINGSEELSVNPTWSRPELLNSPPFNFIGSGLSWSLSSSYQYEGSTRVLQLSSTASPSSEVQVTDTNIVSSGEQVYLRMLVRKTASTLPPVNSVGVSLKVYWMDQDNNIVHHPSNPDEDAPPIALDVNHREGTWNQYTPYDITVTAPPGATKFYAAVTGGNVSQTYLVARTSVRRAMSSVTIDGDETVVSPQGVQVYGRIESSDGYYDRIMLTSMGRMYTAFSPDTGETSSMDGDSVSSPVISGDEVWAGGINVEEELYDRPRGLVVNDFADREGSSSTQELGYREIGFDVEGGRAYLINVSANVDNSGGAGTVFIYLRKTQSETGDAPPPTVNSREFGRMTWYSANSSYFVHGTFLFVPARSENARFLISSRAGSTRLAKIMETNFRVVDIGPFTNLDDSGRYSNGGATPVQPGPTPPPPPVTSPPKQTRTRTWDFAWSGTYNNHGSNTSPWVPASRIRQGSAGSSRYKGLLGIQNATRSAVMGTDIKRIEVYLYNQGPRSKGTARIGTHREASRPGSTTVGGSVYNAYHNVSNWGKNSGKWVRLPSSFHATFAAGQARGITVGNHTTGMDLMDFAATGKHNAKIRITYSS